MSEPGRAAHATPSRASLSPAQLARLAELERGARPRPRIPRRQEGPAPLSFAQERLWFLDQLVPGSPAYNLPVVLRLEGELDPAALAASVRRVIARHEALRTRFVLAGGEPVQEVDPEPRLPPRLVDLSALPAAARESAALRFAGEEVARPFDLARGPLVRLLLVRLAAREHLFLFDVHHIVFDTWSAAILLREMKAFYALLQGGAAVRPAELPIQYGDFAAWQRRQPGDGALAGDLDFWRRRLAGAPVLDLPADRPRPALPTLRGGRRLFHLPAALTGLGASHRVTLFMALLAGFKVLLGRWSGQTDLAVGVPVAGRGRVELEPLVGFFANTLVLRSDHAGDPTFAELLAQVRRVASEAFAHQDLPFERLVAELQPARHTSHTPFFQVMLVVQNAPQEAFELPGVRASYVEVHNRTAKFDLWLSVTAAGERLTGAVEYAADLFDASTVDRLVAHLRGLLAAAAADPRRPLSALPLLRPEERHQTLAEWNDTRDAPLARPVPLQRLFEEQAARTPGALALVADAAAPASCPRLTYGELDALAGRLAGALRRRGAGPGGLVGVALERSPEMVVALLAILKAGAAYVPLDPEHPRERLAFLLADLRRAAGPPLVLTQSRLREVLPAAADLRLLCLDIGGEGCEDLLPREPLPGPLPRMEDIPPESPAYVLYTSGSTGEPKGVAVPHRGIVNRILWMQQAYRLAADDRVLQKTPYSFDVSVWEFFWPLATGACLVLARPGGHRDAVYLSHLIAAQGITTLHFVPPMLQAFLEVPDLARCCAGLRRVICSGEALARELAGRFAARLPGTALYNLYGPTEAAVDVTAWPCDEGPDARPVPIGRPIANISICLLDRRGEPVPPGVPGELSIGGVGLALGYLNRPDLTAERFVPAPFGAAGERLYRTGDLARWRADGAVEFLGRLDHQVKLRGFRIELGEIEASLLRRREVREALAVVREETPGGRRLVAYVVPEAGAVEEAGKLGEQQVADWGQVFDEAYDAPGAPGGADGTFNLASWNSSYTGEPIPAEQMQEWVDGTVGRVLALAPRRVVEVGCGTGLLLFRLAPHCASYLGADVSQRAVRHVEEQLGRRGAEPGAALPRAKVVRAEGLPDLDGERPDLVLLNSVAQYFPSAGYLERLLRDAVAAVGPRGVVFVGDVRNLALLEAFHAAVELARAAPSLPATELHARVRRRVLQERELVLDPAFFRALGRRLPGVRRVEVRLRRGRHRNEMSRFRYDVLLHVGGERGAVSPVRELTWDREGLTLAGLRHLLRDSAPPALVVRGIPNARVAGAVRAAELLARPDRPGTAGRLAALLAPAEAAAVDPEDLWALGSELAYEVEVTWPDFAADGRCDILFRRRELTDVLDTGWKEGPRQEPRPGSPGRPLANDPLLQKLGEHLVPALLRELKERLPDYMVPSALVLLDRLPLSSNGKVARQELPPPPAAEAGQDHVAPGNSTERLLAEIWAEVLGVASVGVTSNFFSLGGDSIHAVQVIARVARRGFALSPRTLFQHQTVAELAAALGTPAAGSAAKREAGESAPFALVDAARRRRLLAADPLAEDAYPLSPLQQHMLAAADPWIFISQMALPQSGPLDRAAFERTWELLAERNPVLRTYFLREPGEPPLQVVRRQVGLPVEWHDWRGLSAGQQAAREEEYFARERARGFDPGTPPPLRVAVHRLSDESWQVAMTVNYACIDGWTTVLLLQQRTALYRALLAGEEPRLPAAAPYRDYIAWVERQDLAPAEAYWRQELAGFARPNPLVARTAPREPVPPAELRREHRFLSLDLSRRLNQRARELRVSLNTLFQGAWLLLLGRYCGTDDVLCGVAVAGRSPGVPGVESIVGSSLNVLPLRARLAAGEPLPDWLARLHERQVERSLYEHTPLDRIREWCEVPRELPLFESYLVFQNQGTSLTAARELVAEIPRTGRMPYYFARMEYPLRIDVMPGPQIALSVADYAGCWDTAALARMADDLEAQLASLAAAGSLETAALPAVIPLGSEGPSARPAVCHGGPAVEDPEVRLLSHALARAARRSPEDGVLHLVHPDGAGALATYPALLAAAERVLGGLRGLGLEPGDEVLLQLEQVEDFLPAFWGAVLGGFVPVPLGFAPSSEAPARAAGALHHAWRLSRRPLVLARREAIGELRALAAAWPGDARAPGGVRLAALEDCRASGADSQWHAGRPDDLALLLLTSGSTGSPKGVMLSHRNVLGSIAGSAQVNGFTSREVSLNWLPMNHVGALMRSLREVYLGCRQIQARTRWVLEDPLRWLDWIERHRVTTTWAPNFAFGLLVERLAPGRRWDLSPLRSLWTSGESIAPRRMERLLELLAPSGLRIDALHTAWGMTEACFATFSHDYLADFRQGERRCPEVGRPIPGISLRIVDEGGRIVPEGTAGRLQIHGPVCTRGYRQEAAQESRQEEGRDPASAGAFTADGWLRTGDLGFLRAGRLTITGREKDVIIVNGLNLSNREIEAAAEEVEGVEISFTAACAVRGADGDTDELAVFFHPSVQGEAELRALLARVREQIVHKAGVNPRYLIPVERAEIPKTEVGKIQRARLKQRFEAGELATALARAEALAGGGRAASPGEPGSEPERRVAAAFAAALGVERVGAGDDFFALGASSLQVVRAAGRLEELFPGREVPAAAIFRHPTARALAGYLAGNEPADVPLVASVDRAEARAELRQGRADRAGRRRGARASQGD